MNQFFEGVQTQPDVDQRIAFGERLLKVVKELRSSSTLSAQSRNAAFINHLLNLGGLYASLDPTAVASGMDDPQLFLETLWRTKDIQKGSTEITLFFAEFSTDEQLKLLQFQQKLFSASQHVNNLDESQHDVFQIVEMMSFARGYAGAQFENRMSDDQESFFFYVWNAWTLQELAFASNLLQDFVIASRQPQEPEFENVADELLPIDCIVASLTDQVQTAQIACPPITEAQRRALEALLEDKRYQEDLRLGIDSTSRGGCIHGPFLGGHIGSPLGTQANYYATQVSGSLYDYLVIDPYGNAKFFDGRTPNTRNLWEAKHRYGGILNPRTYWRDDAIQRMDRELAYEAKIARNCRFTLTVAFSDKHIAQFFHSRWRAFNKQYPSSPVFPRDVRWIPYTGPSNWPIK